jgi:hypothetical protein
MEYKPDASAAEPFDVPETTTFAPGKGFPFSSVTDPETVWAVSPEQRMSKKRTW